MTNVIIRLRLGVGLEFTRVHNTRKRNILVTCVVIRHHNKETLPHISSQFMKKKKKQCNDCDYKSTMKGYLTTHRQSIHEGKKYSCRMLLKVYRERKSY